MKTATSTTTTLLALALAMTAASRPFVPILARMPARLPTEYYARDATASLPELAAQAQELNSKFDGLRLADACTSGEKACVQGTSATCVGGAWAGDDCPNGMRCFALPDLEQGAVILTCTSKTDAKSRIDAAAQVGEPAASETEDGECPDETDAPSSTGDAPSTTGVDAPSSTGVDAPSSTGVDAPAPTSTAAPADDDEDCPAEDDNNAGNDGADDDSCEDTDNESDAPLTPTVVPPASSTGLPVPVSTAPSTGLPVSSTDAPLPTTTPTTPTAPEPEPIETVTSIVIILPPQTLGASATTTTLTPDEASAVLSSLGLSTGLHTSSTIIQPSQTQGGAPDVTQTQSGAPEVTQSGAPEVTQTGAPTEGGYEGGYDGEDYPESGSASVTTTSSAPASTATAADDGDFITPILPAPGASEGAAAPPAVTIS